MTRAGRPLGEFCTRALQLATSRPVTYLDLHLELGLSRRDASNTVHNLLRGEHAFELERRMVPGARKPVPVITAKPPATVEDRLAALAAWPRPARAA